MILLNDVSVVFDSGQKQIHAVNHVTLEVEKGDIYGIIGYSGAGKSTLVRLINLIQKPLSGSVTVDGVDLTKLSQQ